MFPHRLLAATTAVVSRSLFARRMSAALGGPGLVLAPDEEDQLAARLIDVRRDLHRHPELSNNEHRTSAQVARYLERFPTVRVEKIGATGLVAHIGGPRSASAPSVVALRCDLDALPITEATGLSFASDTPGVMHACGHDGHTAIALGAVELLVRQAEALEAPVKVLFQAAEETSDGAQAMVEAGVLEDVGFIFGGHIDPNFDLGTLIVHDGCVNASSDDFCITIEGKGGHAARPHQTIDTIFVASSVVVGLQSIVSREVLMTDPPDLTNPGEACVVTVGRMEAGTANNVVAAQATLQGTVRTNSAERRQATLEALQRMAGCIAAAHRASASLNVSGSIPPVVNDPQAYALAHAAAVRTVGDANTQPLPLANMGAEDFGVYLQHRPGCYIRFGGRPEGREGVVAAHSSTFDFHEGLLITGAKYMAQVALLAAHHLATGGE